MYFKSLAQLGNIEENITFNRELDKDRLAKCIESCYLNGVSLMIITVDK